MPERNIRLTLAYDGTDFQGWQVQSNGRTVQRVLQEELARMHGHPVRVQGAGRTDSGVHATGQVANFRTDLDSIPARRYHIALNSYLPADVRALDSAEVPLSFSAKRDARLRAYAYYLSTGEVDLPHQRRYCWRLRFRPDVAALNRLASVLVGARDFSVFSAAGDVNRSKVRRLESAAFHPAGPFLVFRVAASSFLWKMVRSILGTILEVHQNGGGRAEMEAIVDSRDRSRAGATAPALGLFLERVYYDEW